MKRNIVMPDFIGGLSFAGNGGLNDGKGFYLGQDSNGGISILDTWKRELDRTNSNFVVMGTSGVGKSTAVKHILLNEYMQGTKIIVIDPEREYKTMCENLGGSWVNVIGKNGQIINPLQIRPVPTDDNESMLEEQTENIGAMALHIQTIRPFFKLLFPDITQNQLSILTTNLEEIYNKFDIYWETDITKIPNDKFPIMKDLYDNVTKNVKKADKEYIADYKIVQGLLRDIAIGADSDIFNGYTTVNDTSKCVVLDTFSLQNSDERIKKAQYYNMLTYCWEQISKNRKEKVLLACDEAYLMIDTQVPQSLILLRNIAKRCRKYNAGILIISHSVVDFLDNSIKQYGQAILDMACYKILMGADGKNLEELKELYKLTEAEEDLLYSRQMGKALFFAGTTRLSLNFDIFPYEFNYFVPKENKKENIDVV